ncbi:glycerol-3-phosphate acyltransferase [Paenibacillus eucommiae]|uniref:Glycerol-3-phosphate acyltransferase n=1 Tax=Paenibacillus eucommiae TaxID=1355755 RepID=A0ABS4IQ43_9BACL|nr:glycerol-3-phosphate acyltransferase [Paenibacillus eucommiae]MBP1989131.1 glycerol-3-phosphate acyltransferase PlsY [Paenibacillus eucommiae]
MLQTAVLILAYIVGCFSTAYFLVKLQYGQDIRTLGSRNVGARNAGRMYGSKAFLITFIGDTSKAALVVYAAGKVTSSLTYLLLALLAVIIGHIYPVFLGFKGGKGMSPFAGGALILDWRIFLLMLALALVFLILSRRFSPAGLTAILTFPLLIFHFQHSWTNALIGLLAVFLILYAHRSNIMEIVRSWTT